MWPREKSSSSGNLFHFGNVRVHRTSSTVHYRICPQYVILLRVGELQTFSCKITYFITPQLGSSSVVQGVVLILRLPWCSVGVIVWQLLYIVVDLHVHDNDCMKNTVILIFYGAYHNP